MDLFTSWAELIRARPATLMRCRQKSISQITHSSLDAIGTCIGTLSIQSIDCAYQRRDNKAAASNTAVQVNYSTESFIRIGKKWTDLLAGTKRQRADKTQVIRLTDHELNHFWDRKKPRVVISCPSPKIGICSPAWSPPRSISNLRWLVWSRGKPRTAKYHHTCHTLMMRCRFINLEIQSTPIRVMWWWSSARRSWADQYLRHPPQTDKPT